MNNKIKVILVDDHVLFIEGVRALLEPDQSIALIDTANDGKELLFLLTKTSPDIVLLDINMPGINGIEVCRYVKQSHVQVKVIILSTYKEEHLVEKARQNGAHGYLLKDCTKAELLQAIHLVNRGESVFPHRPQRENDDGDAFLKQFQLTKREIEILRLLKSEMTNQQIAKTLYLSIYTVETHRKNIKQKLNITTQSALIKFLLTNEF